MIWVDTLTDTFRWWGATGALLAIIAIGHWWKNGLGMLDMGERRLAAVTMFFGMVAILLAGTIIPWASDGRVAGFTQDSPLYLKVMMMAWLFWAASAWAASIALAEKKALMILGSLSWFAVTLIAANETVGASL